MTHLWGKRPINSSFHGNQILGIYGENSTTKRSIDIPNGYISEINGMFQVFLLNSAQKSWYKKFWSLINLKLLISPLIIPLEHNNAPSWSILSLAGSQLSIIDAYLEN